MRKKITSFWPDNPEYKNNIIDTDKIEMSRLDFDNDLDRKKYNILNKTTDILYIFQGWPKERYHA